MADVIAMITHLEKEYAWVALPHPYNREVQVIRDILPENVEKGSYHLFSYNGSGVGYISEASEKDKVKYTEVTLVFVGEFDPLELKNVMDGYFSNVSIKSIRTE
jgi:hypothetical protein